MTSLSGSSLLEELVNQGLRMATSLSGSSLLEELVNQGLRMGGGIGKPRY